MLSMFSMFLLKTRELVDLSLIAASHPVVQRNGRDEKENAGDGFEMDDPDDFRVCLLCLREAGEENEQPRREGEHARPESGAAMEIALPRQLGAEVIE